MQGAPPDRATRLRGEAPARRRLSGLETAHCLQRMGHLPPLQGARRMTRWRRTAVSLTRVALATALMASSCGAFAAEPVRQIGIYVEPYYVAARQPGEPPKVAVGASVNG